MIVGCGGPRLTAPSVEPFPSLSPLDGTEVLTAQVDVPELREALLESPAAESNATFLHAELDLLDGQISRGIERFAQVLVAQPNTVLGAVAAIRVDQVQYQIPHREPVEQLMQQLSGATLHPLTAIYVNSIALEAAFRDHRHVSLSNNPAPFSADDLGMPDQWRWLGPLSHRPYLDLDSPQPFDQHQVLNERYEVGGRELRTRMAVADDTLMSPRLDGPGVYVFETWAHLDAAADRFVVLETALGANLSIDEITVLTRRETGAYQPTLLFAPVRLTAGWHRIRLVVGITESDNGFRLRLVPKSTSTPGLQFAAAPPARVVMGEAGTASEQPTLTSVLPAEVVEPQGLVEAYLLMILSSSVGDEGLGQVALDALLSEQGYSALAALAASELVGGQAVRAPYERQSARLQLVREAADLAPSAGGAAIRLALLLSSDGRNDLALELLEPLAERLSHEPAVHLLLYSLYSELLFDELAETSIRRVLDVAPESCLAVGELGELLRYRNEFPPLEELPPGFRTCDEGLDYQINQLLLPQGRIDLALELLGVLSARHPQNLDTRRRIIDLTMREGRAREAQEALSAASENGMTDAEQALLYADMFLALEQPEEAAERLTAGLSEHPSQPDLLRLKALLDRSGLLADLRADPLEAIEAYLAADLQTTAPVVYALDYAAMRYFEDGSGVSVTHQVFHVLSREALGDYGEVAPPEGAVLLRARTIKADGTILEPDNIPGKDTVSVPNLEVGDFVELEYFEIIRKESFRAQTMIGTRFYFQIFEAPLAVSELVVEVPSSWTDVVVDRRGSAPEPEITRGADFHRYRFRAVGSYPAHDEPRAPPLEELLPSVRIAHDLRWSDIRDQFRDRELSAARVVSEMQPFVEHLVADAPDDRERARRIYRYVMDEIEEVGGFLSTDAVWTLGSGEGERLPVLLALLRVGGFEPEVVFLRSWSDDQTDSPIPDASALPRTAVRIRIDDDDIWLSTGTRFAPFDFLDPSIQGTRGLVISGSELADLRWIETPRWPDELNRQGIDVHLEIDAAGNLLARVNERVAAGSWATLRTVLHELQDERFLTQELERNLSESFPGVALTSFEAVNLEDPDTALFINYTFTASGFADVDGNLLTIARRVFDRNLRGQLGSEPSRNYPLQIDYPTLEEMRLEIVLPEDYLIEEIPPEMLVSTPWLDYSWRVEDGGVGLDHVTLTRTTSIAVTRVTPDEYSELAEALGRIDLAESLRLTATR